jgi:hypothetical protein
MLGFFNLVQISAKFFNDRMLKKIFKIIVLCIITN